MDEYVGQRRVVENLRIYIRAAKQRGEAMDHVLLAALQAWARHHWRTLLRKMGWISDPVPVL